MVRRRLSRPGENGRRPGILSAVASPPVTLDRPAAAPASLWERPAVLRYLGLFGSLCCAADAFLFGAGPRVRSGVSVVSIMRGPHGLVILLLWAAGLAALCLAWWHGRRLAGRGLLSRRWILVTAALWVLPLLVVPPLGSRDMYAYACQGALFDSGHNPYVDSVSTQPCPWLESVSSVWRTTPTPYGPLFILLTGAAAAAGSQLAALVAYRVLAVLGVAGIAAAVPVLARRAGAPVERALWLVVCCPLVPVHLIGGGHNDAVTVALLVAGLAMVAGPERRRAALVAGGVLLGLSVSLKTTIGVVLPFAALLAAGGLPAGGWPRLLRRGGTVVGAALATLLVLSYASGLGLGWVTALSGANAAVGWTSPPTAVGLAIGAVAGWFGVHVYAVPAVRFVALVLLPLVLLVLVWRSRRRDPLAGAGLALLAVIFLAPITQPWYLMWPLAVFAVSTARARWLAGTVVVSMATVLPDGSGSQGPLRVPLSLAMVALVGWVAWRSVGWLRGAEITLYSTDDERRPRPAVTAASAPSAQET
jgi:hypothetical protein